MSAIGDEIKVGTVLYECVLCHNLGINTEDIADHIRSEHLITVPQRIAANTKEVVVSAVEQDRSQPSLAEKNAVEPESAVQPEICKDTEDRKLWPTASILVFIGIVEEHAATLEMARKKSVAWDKISTLLSEKLLAHWTGQQCNSKWKGLLKTYKEIKLNNSTLGKKRKNWEFFEIINNFLYKKPEITPVATCSSHAGLVVTEKLQEPEHEVSLADTVGKAKQESHFQSRRRMANSLERRHKEKLERMDKYLETFERLVNNLSTKKCSVESIDSE